MDTGQELRDAAKTGEIAVLEKLLNIEPGSVNSQSQQGISALHLAAENEKAEAVKLLIKRGANVNLCDTQGRTPLVLAVTNRHTCVAEILLENKADVKSQDNQGSSALHLAAENGKAEAVELLIKYGANVDLRDTQGRTPLALAATKGHTRAVEILLKNNADVNSQSQKGSSALHQAADQGKVEVVKLLIKQGANVNIRDTLGRTPLALAAKMWQARAGEILLKNNADVKSKDNQGNNLLLEVVRLALSMKVGVPAVLMVRVLLQNTNPKDEEGKEEKENEAKDALKVVGSFMVKQGFSWQDAQPLLVELSSHNFVYRRAIVCCDGTWNDRETEQPFTNVAKLISCIASEANYDHARYEQIPYYIDGIGTGTTWLGSRMVGATGEGITRKIREGYRHLCSTYRFKGDQIVLIGFSRGAFTIHCLAKFVSEVGLLNQEVVNKELPAIFELWHQGQSAISGGDSDLAKRCDELNRKGKLRREVEVDVLAAWDMVKALKTSFFSRDEPFSFIDGRLPLKVKKAFHALALDERRNHFQPVILSSQTTDQLKQCWFLGSHSDIGGGGDNGGLSNIPLCWMISQLKIAVQFNEEAIWDTTEEGRVLDFEEGLPDTKGNYAPGALRIINLTKSDSFVSFWRFLGSVLRDPGNPFVDGHKDGFKSNETMHFSVRALPAIVWGGKQPSNGLALKGFNLDMQGPRWIATMEVGKERTIMEDRVHPDESYMLHRWMDRDFELEGLFKRGEKRCSKLLPPADMGSMGWEIQPWGLRLEHGGAGQNGQEGEEAAT